MINHFNVIVSNFCEGFVANWDETMSLVRWIQPLACCARHCQLIQASYFTKWGCVLSGFKEWDSSSIPGIESRWGARFSAPVQTGPGAHPASCTMGTSSFPEVKSGWGVTLTPYPLIVPWSRKSRAVPVLPHWAIQHVQSLSACTRVHFTFLPFLQLFNVFCA